MHETLSCAHDKLFSSKIDVKHALESHRMIEPKSYQINKSLYQYEHFIFKMVIMTQQPVVVFSQDALNFEIGANWDIL